MTLNQMILLFNNVYDLLLTIFRLRSIVQCTGTCLHSSLPASKCLGKVH